MRSKSNDGAFWQLAQIPTVARPKEREDSSEDYQTDAWEYDPNNKVDRALAKDCTIL